MAVTRPSGHRLMSVVGDLNAAFRDGRLVDAMSDPRYYNIRVMQDALLK